MAQFNVKSHSQPHIAEPLTVSQVAASESGSDNGVLGTHEEILKEAVNTPSDDDVGDEIGGGLTKSVCTLFSCDNLDPHLTLEHPGRFVTGTVVSVTYCTLTHVMQLIRQGLC
ncbi:hypothetical protein B0H14DRAFT_3155147 [Mycena olivaceomarginata]|nr:hypothetical protein B0H14DRAFT_3155147 [Mycena olivaceomarginata]